MVIGFIGAGRMASAIIRGLIDAGTCRPEEIIATDIDDAVLDLLSSNTGVRCVGSVKELISQCETIMLCVKPGDASVVLSEVGALPGSKLLISIAAGVRLSHLEEMAPECRIIRVMPNTPALVHKGAAAFSLGQKATESDADLVQSIFTAVGTAFRTEEKNLDAVTGLSGSGPAYVFLIIDALADGGVMQGLPRSLALQLAAQTVAGAAEMILQTGEHPGQLKDNVASPGGTTMAGLAILEAAAVRSALIESVAAATERSRELGDSSSK
jgi:pyrroline-5-carboxylate reductase